MEVTHFGPMQQFKMEVKFVEKINKLLVWSADDFKVWLLKVYHKCLSYTDHAFRSFFDGTLLTTLQ